MEGGAAPPLALQDEGAASLSDDVACKKGKSAIELYRKEFLDYERKCGRKHQICSTEFGELAPLRGHE